MVWILKILFQLKIILTLWPRQGRGHYNYISIFKCRGPWTRRSQRVNTYIEQQKKFYELYDLNNSNNALNETIKNSVVTKVVFCSYDFFIDEDFRIIFNFPDGFDKFYFFGGKINDYNIAEDKLKTIFLSSVLSSWNFNLINDNKINYFNYNYNFFFEKILSLHPQPP